MWEHEQVLVRRGERSGLPVVVAVHSTARGPALGGCRLRHYPDRHDDPDAAPDSALADALRLAAAMTDKTAAAGMRFGGGKTVVALPPGPPPSAADRRALLLDVGDAVAVFGGRYLVGPDVGTGPDDMAVIAERTSHVLCTPGGSGDSSPHTARAALACVRAVVRHRDGSPGLAGRRIVLIGLGHVGEPLARALAADGAELVVTDIDPSRRRLAAELDARWVEPWQAWREPADVLVPSALGDRLTVTGVADLRCAAVAGPANNQLADDTVADALHEHGVLWAPDFLVGAGGIVHATAVEIDRVTDDELARRLRAPADQLALVLDRARAGGVSPLTAVRALVRERAGRIGA